MPAHRYLSTPRASRVLGVSESTVKRWVDDGLLRAHKTPGGHRRILAGDLLNFARANELPCADLAPLFGAGAGGELPASAQLVDQLAEALERGDADAARSLVASAYRRGLSVERLADEVVAPAMARVGHGWEAGRLDVYQEHRGTQACLAALLDLKAQLRPAGAGGRPAAVGGCPEHDHYLLATLLAGMVLRENGWDAVNVGPNTPVASFRKALRELKPRLLWISFSHLQDAEQFLAEYRPLYEEARAAGVSVAVGGRALTEPVRARMPYTAFGDSLAHLAAFAQTLHPTPRRPRRGRPAG